MYNSIIGLYWGKRERAAKCVPKHFVGTKDAGILTVGRTYQFPNSPMETFFKRLRNIFDIYLGVWARQCARHWVDKDLQYEVEWILYNLVLSSVFFLLSEVDCSFQHWNKWMTGSIQIWTIMMSLLLYGRLSSKQFPETSSLLKD